MSTARADPYAIDVRGLGVQYSLRLTRKTTMHQSFIRVLRRHEGPTHFWALRDVSFRVEPGQMAALVG